MNKGLCKDCIYQTDASLPCNHPVALKIITAVEGESNIRVEIRRQLKVQFQPFSWAVRWCNGWKREPDPQEKILGSSCHPS